MYKNNLIILLVILSFTIILNATNNIVNFEEITYPSGISEYSYQFSDFVLTEVGEPFFFFHFSNPYNVQLKIIDKENNEYDVKVSESNWTCYNIPNLRAQKYIFQIINNNEEEGNVIFIDNTVEIKTDIKRFLQLSFYRQIFLKKPLPLIFQFDTIKEDLYYKFEKENNYFSDGNYLIYICQFTTSEKECEYEEIDTFYFESGKNYKIKLEWSIDEYNSNSIFINQLNDEEYIIKEIFLGESTIEINETDKNYAYFIFNTENVTNNIYSYVKVYSYQYTTISEEEKSLLPSIIDTLSFKSISTSSTFLYESLTLSKQYLLLKIPNKGTIFISLANYYSEIHIQDNFFKEFPKNTFAVLYFFSNSKYNMNLFITSTNKNIKRNGKEYNNYIYIDIFESFFDGYINVNSINEKTIIRGFKYNYYSGYNFRVFFNEELKSFFLKYGPDSMYMRTSSHSINCTYNFTFLFDIDENYYLFIKKYHGKTNIFQYTNKLSIINNIANYRRLDNYQNPVGFKSINNELLMMSGFQLFTYFMYYNSLFDFYIQKVDDLEIVNINSNISKFKNLVKLFIQEKEYILNFSVDHLIKLDNNFLNAEVKIYDNDNEYILNGENKIIKILNKKNMRVKTNNTALLYFYKRINNYYENSAVIFDPTQKGKNMKFNITNKNNEKVHITLVRDFGFEGYYPLLSERNWDEISSVNTFSTIYVDNYYDKLEYDLYKDEKYIIYIFDSIDGKSASLINSNDYEITNITYVSNLLTPNNKYNFEVISPNQEGSIILHSNNKRYSSYQFMICKSKKIEFQIENSHGIFDTWKGKVHPYKTTITRDYGSTIALFFEINKDEKSTILSHTFKADDEFLFSYFFELVNPKKYELLIQ